MNLTHTHTHTHTQTHTNDYHNKFSQHPSPHIITKKFFFLLMRTFKIYTLSDFHVYDTVLLTTVMILYITTSGLITNWVKMAKSCKLSVTVCFIFMFLVLRLI